jgi:hypothetical protein
MSALGRQGPNATIWMLGGACRPEPAFRLAGAGRSERWSCHASEQRLPPRSLVQMRETDGSASWLDTSSESAVAKWENGMSMASFLDA